jgi:hypothetical protein
MIARSMACYGAMMLPAPAAGKMAAMCRQNPDQQIRPIYRSAGRPAPRRHRNDPRIEYQASNYFKRRTAIEETFGDTDYDVAALDRMEGGGPGSTCAWQRQQPEARFH